LSDGKFKKTTRQVEQTKLMASDHKFILSYGGSRASKTFGICRAMIVRASKTKSRHVALRLNFNHAKMSLWHETFPKVFSLCFPDLDYDENKTDYFYTLPNGSEIFVGGLDDKKRVEKILGKEYSTMFFNEVSQIPYTSYSMAITRLAEKNELKKKVYLDCNPPRKSHWTYPLFIEGLDPDTWEPKKDAHRYASILMNPHDNLENIDPDYLSMLEGLPEKERARFLHGEFTDDDNTQVYYSFKRDLNVKNQIEINKRHPLWIGMDFNISPMSAVICQSYDDSIFVLDELFLMTSNTNEMADAIAQKYGRGHRIVPDSTGKRKQTSSAGWSDHEILRNKGFKVASTNNPFRMDRYNTVNLLLEKQRLLIDKKCVKLIRDLEQVSYKEGTNLQDLSGDKTLGHISDALGYLCYYHHPILKPSTDIVQIR
jgi:phage terminase large subunit